MENIIAAKTTSLDVFNNSHATNYLHKKHHQRRIQKALELIRTETDKTDSGHRKAIQLLSIGCGAGHVEKHILGLGITVHGVDVAGAALKEAKKLGVKTSIADISQGLPYNDENFDLVFAGEIIEHLFDTERFLLEVKRILKVGGHLIVTTPNMARLADRIRFLFGKAPKHASPMQMLHIRPFTFDSLKMVLEDTGFRVTDVKSNVVAYDPTLIFNFKSRRLADLFPTLGKNLIVKAVSRGRPRLRLVYKEKPAVRIHPHEG